MNKYVVLLLALLVVGCQKSKTAAIDPTTKIDACSLITKDEIQKVQGSPVTDAKSSEAKDDNFQMGQCFYTTDPFHQSVSLAVTQRAFDSPKARDPKEFWQATFGRFNAKGTEREGDEEKKKSLGEQDDDRGGSAKKIEGVGDDAFWSANRVGGSLYVLKGNVFIRISVGGTDNEETKLKKSKALAATAISRF